MELSDFRFDLPAELIAQHPLPERSSSRLLTLDGRTGALADRGITDLPELLVAGDLLVFNDTRVMRARLYGEKETGGKVEVLIERLLGAREAWAQIRASKSPGPGARIIVADAVLEVRERDHGRFRLASPGADFEVLMEHHGHVPLPPYIRRPDQAFDAERYQTVYARRSGAVAAPTAGLHFDDALIDRLRQRGVEFAQVTLHVGPGTFRPVRTERIAEHRMHSEWFEVDAGVCGRVEATRARGGRVVAVGTTSVRSLESAARTGRLLPVRGDTDLFITPGYRFRVVDAILTNFHLPESTLLMLVCAFGGYGAVMAAYRHAIAAGYRFFSYGDAMFVSHPVAEP